MCSFDFRKVSIVKARVQLLKSEYSKNTGSVQSVPNTAGGSHGRLEHDSVQLRLMLELKIPFKKVKIF